MSQSALTYPAARRETARDVRGGLEVADPYHWLETADAPDTRAWVEAENDLSRSLLAGLPGRDRLRALLTHSEQIRPIEAPVEAGGRFFSRWLVPGRPQPVLMVQDGLGAQPKPLVDPSSLSAAGGVSIDWWYASPSGRLIALGLTESSAEVGVLRIFDVEANRFLDERIPGSVYATVSWWPDEAGLWLTRYEGAPNASAHAIYSHKLGTPHAQDECLYRAPESSAFLWLMSSPESRHLVFFSGPGGFMNAAYLLDKHQPGPARPLRQVTEGRFLDGRVQGERFYVLTTDGAPRGRVLTWDLDRSTDCDEAVPESEDAIINLLPVGDRLVLEVIQDAANRLLVLAPGKAPVEVPLPALGDVASTSTGRWAVYMSGAPDAGAFNFTFSSLLQPVSIYRYVFQEGRLESLYTCEGSVDPRRYVVRQVFYPSADGTRIPMFLVHAANLEPDGHHPTLLHAYGGFGIAQAPGFNGFRHAWLAAGGILALPCVRGGGEYGAAWHRAGKREQKPNTFADVCAAAEWLIKEGYTRPERLGFEGRSNGGLVAAAVMTARPDLFGAIVGRVPVADMMRYHVMSAAGQGQLDEFGSPDDPALAPVILGYSPYHRVTPGTRYPAAFFLTAEHDMRVPAAHGFKLVAALQHAQAGEGPILLQHALGAGHGAGRPLTLDLEENVDVLAFLAAQLGLTVPR